MRMYRVMNTGGFGQTVFAPNPVAALQICLERAHIRKLKNGKISDQTDHYLAQRGEETRRALAANVAGVAVYQVSPLRGWMIDEHLY